MTSVAAGPAGRHVGPAPAWLRRGRRQRFDKQPTQPAAVLIASLAEPISKAVVTKAVALADHDAVAVVTTVRIYGSAYGLPNPGLMPTRQELEAARGVVERTTTALERSGLQAWGQVAATRRPAKVIAEAARARGVRHVLVVAPPLARWRAAIEGDLVKDIARRLPSGVTVVRA